MNDPTPAGAILLVDDDENDVFFFQRACRKTGLPIALHLARDGLEAIHYLDGAGPYADRRRHPLPGLVVLDLHMPVRNGLEVLEWLRRQEALRALPVVVLTSSNSAQDVAAAYRLGANSYLLKPAAPDLFLALIQQLTAYWLLANQPPPAAPAAA